MRKNVLIIVLVILVAVLGIGLISKIYQGQINDYFQKHKTTIGEANPPLEPFPPYFISPKENSKVTSPLIVQGVVPTGWMFEGIVQVKLLDANRNVIAQAPGEEVNPGGWMDKEPDEFKATLTFTTAAKYGYLVVGADNPSGLPENDKSYEIPVKF